VADDRVQLARYSIWGREWRRDTGFNRAGRAALLFQIGNLIAGRSNCLRQTQGSLSLGPKLQRVMSSFR
jgi:hypothetical protein